MFVISLFVPEQIVPAGAESTLETYGAFLKIHFFHISNDSYKKLEQIKYKINRSEVYVLLNQTGLKVKMLPRYTHTHTHTHTHIYIYYFVLVYQCVF